ncbi:phage protein [Martelella lutilitoris]|uniref:phage protein n=1 Tax=Martelella lutilitoris TaxID=2583532 RepID=UPI003D7C2542
MINPGNETGHQIRIEFSINKGISSKQNSADIRLYNLTESHRNAMGKEFDSITLEAGYIPPGDDGNVGVIFKGAVRDVEHEKTQDGNIITTISCGDGDKAIRKATISKSYPKGTPVKTVVKDIYAEMEKKGMARGEWKFPDNMKETFDRPYAMCGMCSRELDVIGKGHKFYWSSQNETLEIIPGDGTVGGIVLLTPDTGMIGTPSITDNGVRVSCLLNPEIRPNRRVQIKSDTLEMNASNGIYRVSEVSFTGNNQDGEFRCDLTCEAIKGGKVDEGVK